MFQYFKRSGNMENNSDIVSEVANVNISDSAPILSNRNFDLGQSQNSVHHDLRSNTGDDVSLIKRSLRTVPGVFCPVALSMCSVAVFMRIGFVVGNSGFYQSIGLYILTFSIFVFTGLSVCAISTNGAIQGGGVYYMISRALGPEFGGSIGTLFFFANAIGSGFNAAALVEAMLSAVGVSQLDGGLPEGRWWKVLYGSAFNLITLVIALLGANLFSVAVSFIFMMMFVSYSTVILSIFIRGPMDIELPGLGANQTGQFTGLSSQTFSDNLYSNYTIDYTNGDAQTSFAYVFGVLFSSLVGVMAGANMSGELKKPSKSIPIGTMSAIVFVFVLYFLENILLAASCERVLLVNNVAVLQEITWGGSILVPLGILATTFSGELSGILGGSRVLKALVDDELFGPIFGFIKFGTTKSGNPVVAVLITYAIAQLTLFIGSLNAIAPLLTIFYLLAYFGVNLATLAMDLASAPNFRPTFKYFSWHTSLLGMVGSLSMTFITSVEYASIAVGLLIALITVLYFRDFPPEWGSISQALIFHQVRKYLLLLDTRKDHVKFWRPQILLLISNPRSCLPLIEFGNDVKKGGLFVLGNVKTGELNEFDEDPCARELPIWMSLVENLKVKAFIELTLNKSLKEGIHNLIRISGLGGMKPNTVMMGFYDNATPVDLLSSRPFPKKRRNNYGASNGLVVNGSSSLLPQFQTLREADDTDSRIELDVYVDIIRDVLKMKKNLVISRRLNLINKKELKAKTEPIYIDVWPMNFLLPEFCTSLDSTCLFMLQLACILNMVSVWKRATVRVFLCSDSQDAAENDRRKSRLDDLLNQLRIHALTVIVPMETTRNLISRPLIKEEDAIHYQTNFTNPEILNVSDVYLKGVNQMVKQYSEGASLCFMYLPPPPAPYKETTLDSNITQDESLLSESELERKPAFISTSEENQNKSYIKMLELISDSLPPCVYINGVNCVTSTQL